MSENTNTTAVVETPAAAKKTPTPRKKSDKKASPAKKGTPSKNGKAESAPRAKKEGLRGPQVRILNCLKKANKPFTRKQIAEKAPCDLAFLTEYVGSHDPEIRAKNDAKQFPSLLTLGYVKAEQHDVDGKDVIQYVITAKGKTALEKADK